MKRGYLSQYFDGVAVKILSPVEVNGILSNQHEFNGVGDLKDLLGKPEGKVKYNAKFLYLTDYESDPIIEDGFLTWYDAREKARKEKNVMRYEYRLYFPTNQITQLANPKDLLVIAKRPDGTLLAIIAESETTIASQILWLFGFSEKIHPGFSIREELDTEQDRISFASRLILESIGVNIEENEFNYLDEMIQKFGMVFPSTREFSAYARSSIKGLDIKDDPDTVLMTWIEKEEILFRTFEKYMIAEKLSKGFSGDVENFLSYSLSIQNRRKSRAGLSLENHLEELFNILNIQNSRTAITENKSKPDFIFPGKKEYHNNSFNPMLLTMLGVKSTCKDRWRQVLAEADRIENKHLLTLEAAISKNQTDEMQSKKLQLVIPKQLHETYSDNQKNWLISLSDFVNIVREKQNKPVIFM